MIKKIAEKFLIREKVSESITRNAVLIAIMGIASRLLGLIRDRALASKFGAGEILDVYYAAFKIPDFIYSFLILGTVSAAFVPIFTELICRKKDEDAWKLVNVLLTVILVALSVLAIILFIFTPVLVEWLTVGFDPERKELVATMTRVMLLSPIILGVSSVMGGILNSFKKFFYYSLAPVFYNLGIIIGVVFLSECFGPIGLAWGVILGALMHLLVQIPETINSGLKFSFQFDLKNKNLYRIIILMIPRALGTAVYQINLLVVTVIASTLTAGSLAIFTFADNIQSVSLGVFGISFATAAFPILSILWAEGKRRDFVERLIKTIRKILFLIIPISALTFVLRAQIVRVILGGGRFDWEDTMLTLECLGVFTISLWAQGIIPVLSRAFYAIQNTFIPFMVGIFSTAINVIIAVYLIKNNQILAIFWKWLGYNPEVVGNFEIVGLVWAFSISSIINALLLFFILRAKIGTFSKQGLFKMLIKVLVATLIMVFVTQAVKNFVGAESFGVKSTFLGVFVQLSLAAGSGFVAYVILSYFLSISEVRYFVKIIKRYILKIKKQLVV